MYCYVSQNFGHEKFNEFSTRNLVYVWDNYVTLPSLSLSHSLSMSYQIFLLMNQSKLITSSSMSPITYSNSTLEMKLS